MIEGEPRSTTWVEVSASALHRNYTAVAAHAGVPVCAVVKANGYGHGLAEAARVFERAGARWLAVTRVEEARALRAARIESRILVLTPPPSAAAVAEAATLRCSVTLADAGDVARFAAAAAGSPPLPVHVKVDTGMGRLGVAPRDALGVCEQIVARPELTLEGVFTHFADAAGSSGAEQLRRFEQARSALGKYAARAMLHASNSAATLALPGARFDMVRVGTLLYGQNPPGASASFPLAETFTWYATLVSVRTLNAGDTVGYGSEWRAKRTTRAGTLAVGWADGFTAEPAARTPAAATALTSAAKAVLRADPRAVFFGTVRAPVLGRVGMQAVTVALDDIPDARVGSVARIPARRLLVNPLIDRVVVD